MNVWPLRFRDMPEGILFSDDAGGWFRSDDGFLERYAAGRLTDADRTFLAAGGQHFDREGDLTHTSFLWRWANRHSVAGKLAYVILVPTLRCNLTCGYCQVSRASETAKGYDWTPETLEQVIGFLDNLDTDAIKIEFQGGEPLLRTDLLESVRSFCRERFSKAEFVVCTNLQRLSPTEWAFLEAEDTFTSTSIDGPAEIHEQQRTRTADLTSEFFRNVEVAVSRLGPERLSALPTIDVSDPPDMNALIDLYEGSGVRSIYLRPVNHQGFARRRHSRPAEIQAWNRWHSDFIELLIQRIATTGRPMEEYYFSHCLRRVLAGDAHNHVDLRNPSLVGSDYILIDFDGTLYPTDEARMMARVGQIDLSIGRVSTGLDHVKVATLNANSFNDFDPDCIHCVYQPFCGKDWVDDLSRYGRIDVPRHTTWFCQRHTALFDKIFELIYRDDTATRSALAMWAGIGSWPAELAQVYQ